MTTAGMPRSVLSDLPGAVRWEVPSLDAPNGQGQSGSEPLPQPPTLEEIEAIQRAAHAEGHADGYREGQVQAQAESRVVVARLEGLLDAMWRPMAQLEDEVEQALAALATRIAGVLLREAYIEQPERLAALVHEAVDSLGESRRRLEVRLHPDDLNLLKPLLSDLHHARLAVDASLARGDLRVHAEDVRLDARISTRLEQILHRLRKAPAAQDVASDNAAVEDQLP
ncbi:MAG: flagellar assembly protein H [Alphaproteobacteria bacterium ADurb.BinA280]|jgi:flagellar assembly protein FliH|nr:flagellar assembly protein FliH [Xanthomonadales bacterium]MCC6505258.1 flagellar assembly protein FliH [Aquimonas sp.]OPZ13584.1 MAG: flagellar assembly protein H [Alphaproteobacteria bacterium ADurb.BinA280]